MIPNENRDLFTGALELKRSFQTVLKECDGENGGGRESISELSGQITPPIC